MKSITPIFSNPPNKFQLNWFSFFWPFFHNTQLRHVCDFNYHTLKTTTYDKCIAPFTTHTKKQFWVPKNQKCRRAECVISTVQYTIEEGLIYLSPGF